MKYYFYPTALFLVGAQLSTSAIAVPVVYSDEALFRAAAGTSTTYGFEDHGYTEGSLIGSPLSASNLDNSFDLGYTNQGGFQISEDLAPTDPDSWAVEGSHYLFTSSLYGPNITDYTLTFSNFSNSNASITAFGITISDFASGMTDEVSITYDIGGVTGTLLQVVGGQIDHTHNFLGLTVDSAEAFSSITLTLNDNNSGWQGFDEVIFSPVASVPEPGMLALLGLGALGFMRRSNKKHVSVSNCS